MNTTYKSLRDIFPKLIHCTCLVHGLNRVCEEIRVQYPDVNTLIHSIKGIFLKSRVRVRLFHQELPDVPLPPKPVITRFATWLSAVLYYSIYFERVSSLIIKMDSAESSCIMVLNICI